MNIWVEMFLGIDEGNILKSVLIFICFSNIIYTYISPYMRANNYFQIENWEEMKMNCYASGKEAATGYTSQLNPAISTSAYTIQVYWLNDIGTSCREMREAFLIFVCFPSSWVRVQGGPTPINLERCRATIISLSEYSDVLF